MGDKDTRAPVSGARQHQQPRSRPAHLCEQALSRRGLMGLMGAVQGLGAAHTYFDGIGWRGWGVRVPLYPPNPHREDFRPL